MIKSSLITFSMNNFFRLGIPLFRRIRHAFCVEKGMNVEQKIRDFYNKNFYKVWIFYIFITTFRTGVTLVFNFFNRIYFNFIYVFYI